MEAEANSPLKSALMPKIDHLEQSDLPVNKEKCDAFFFQELNNSFNEKNIELLCMICLDPTNLFFIYDKKKLL